jgi:ribulose-phosphate 3-epimerase
MDSSLGFVGAAAVLGVRKSFWGNNACSVRAPATHGLTSMLYGPPRPVQIIPSVLPADWANMGADCKRLEDAGVDRVQFDVMDGNFVPNLTFGPELIKACRKYTSLPFETQLMVSNYNSDTMLDDYVQATKGPNGEPGVVIVHVEACTHLHRSLARIRALGGSPSVALNPHTPAEMVENVLDLVDHVLVMTVNPGFGGKCALNLPWRTWTGVGRTLFAGMETLTGYVLPLARSPI